ncbi:phosphopyruvate hydratase [Helicobacter saguini]|uniref:Enolase n=1 Tax=Helicobacter saguini TaxID=1548018 RepID=A0A347VN62_9HELI|nr:phosphopyruvate hydratase [Helicobacter saguini]MWV61888.1 phosphopyruvate hydratase [Helicobacter saguini]MWV67437.1 phosphopyruvate hydratase [Helicobacter saguini]MWV69790.1 phosphopyruvate hydratase [Helicobacter saguini]MWV72993.1 phosphopyruvate hydratase [Helicobacter saguini]TLD95627.1 phosphopyruvate hydratase [Helicobacter saguini]
MATIRELDAFEVLDSRGNPSICVKVSLNNGALGSAIVPSGASTGKREALELRDKDDSRFSGKGVLKACANVTEVISRELIGMDAYRQAGIDYMLKTIDNTENFEKLGANATLGVSMAVARAAANSLNIPLFRYLGGINAATLPAPMLNIINGGSHADNNVDFQEYMIMPLGFECFKRALRASVEVYHELKKLLNENHLSTGVGDEGGFAPNLKNNEEPITYILKAIEKAGYKPGEEISIALDIASSEFYENGFYNLKGEGKKLDSKGLVEYYENLVSKYPIVSIEDGLSEDDWDGWAILTQRLGSKIQLVGDDLFVTNAKILQNGIDKKIANAILIKPNQIGTVSQTLEAIRLAQRNNYKTIISHRSGESEDSFIADLSVAVNAGEIKTGAPARGERNAKYNRLLELRHLNKLLTYEGKSLFR